MAIQKFALYDLIVDIIPGAISLVVLYSVLPTGVYQDFFGINASIVPSVAIVLLSYPVGRVFVHGLSSKMENILRSCHYFLYKAYANMSAWLSSPPLNEILKPVFTDVKQTDSDERSKYDYNTHVEQWLRAEENTPPAVAPSVVRDVRVGIVQLIGSDADVKALCRYGENILYSRDTLYGKYEILSTFYRHISFTSILAFAMYLVYLIIHEMSIPPQLDIAGSAPISEWPLIWIATLPFLALGAFILSLWRWNDWTLSRNRAFINDLHIYLREQDQIS
jgi:hypothetical protein